MVSKKTLIITTSLALAGSVLLAGSAFAKHKKHFHKAKAILMEIDQNKDKAIQKNEFKIFLKNKFSAADKDQNKMVEGKEIADQIGHRRGKHMAKRAIKMFDVNGDKKISHAELEARSDKIFAFFDVNNDGKVERSELPFGGKHKHHKKR